MKNTSEPGSASHRSRTWASLKRAGTDEALQTYKTALEVFPGHVPTEQALARLYLRSGAKPEELAGMLERIAMRGGQGRGGGVGATSPSAAFKRPTMTGEVLQARAVEVHIASRLRA